jgi:4-amino-4-deoxy-L-arabinose transferase-like glycosyltransferase
LYYGLQVIPLKLAATGDFLDRLLAMRLFSVLFAGLTAAFAFLFLRELMPGAPYAWPAGALALAVQPLLGFISGGVNNDAAMFAAGAAVLWLVARAFRRGLDTATAIGLGAAVGLGLVMKATLVGLAPGLLVVLAVLLARAEGRERRRILRLAAVATGVAAAPVVAYLVLNVAVWDRPLWSGVPGSNTGAAGRPAQLPEFLSYLWQFYLPRLPFMTDLQGGLPVYNVWFKGFIGKFGWLDTTFPQWAYTVAVGVFTVVLALAVAAFWRARGTLARRWGELLAYAVLVAGLLVVVGWAGYGGRLANGFIFEQTRYLLALGALYAAVVAGAAMGAGRRLGPPVGATLVVLACGHLLMSMLLVVGRFYA